MNENVPIERRAVVSLLLVGEPGKMRLEACETQVLQLGAAPAELPPGELWEAWMALGRELVKHTDLHPLKCHIANTPWAEVARLIFEKKWPP
jgi:hypothetical protein